MKKSMALLLVAVMALTGCQSGTSGNQSNNSSEKIEEAKELTIDYNDAESFEKALNDGVDVENKVVKFEVSDYKPDSALGYDAWAGEHLNFISDDDIKADSGDEIIARVNEFDKKLGSWVIKYTLIEKEDSNGETNIVETTTIETTTVKKIKVVDLTKYSKSKAKKWCKKNGLEYDNDTEYSSKVELGKAIKQSVKAGTKVEIGEIICVTYSLGRKPTQEELNALAKAEAYSEQMYMSKKAIYNQLTSEYGEGFPDKAAQYAIDNLDVNYKKNALEKAKEYYTEMAMSKNEIYEQLVSDYGEQFTAEEAQYAIKHLDD